ncbi:MAG: yknZ 1 [Gemmataceae bacterium]|nr:yknZ 1 [Gemmataceae bacterium]
MYFVSFILKNLIRRPIRTALTVLGLAVAVGSMIALLGISHNVERAMSEVFEQRGVDLVVMEDGKPDQLRSEIDERVLDRVRAIEGVEGVDAAMVDMIEIKRPSGSSDQAMVLGWAPGNLAYSDLTILSGRALQSGDRGKAMLGVTLARNHNKKVGDTVVLQGEPFEVVGIFQSFNVYENGSVIILLEEMQRLSGRPGIVTGFSVRVRKNTDDPAAEVEAVRRKILALRDENGKPYRLSVQPYRDYVQTSSHIKILRALVWMVSAVAIAIGVISMLNTMVMSVLERTQEIGILRAVGWPKGRVVRMVLGESVVLGLAAAAVGVIGAIAFTYLLTRFPKVNGFIEPGIAPVVIAQGFVLTALIGLLGGTYPAIRAARLLPTEALRHD